MNNIKIEKWLDHEIRFVEHKGEWWAVAADICKALGLTQVTRALKNLKNGVTTSKVIDSLGREQEANIVDEKSIYKLVFRSRKKEAEEFQDWVYNMLRELRKATGLEGFQIFRLLDKEHQKEMMETLKTNLDNPNKISYIKANTIANKAVSKAFGYDKSIKKEDMTPDMLVRRQAILNDTVELMTVKEKYGIDLSVSQNIYNKHCN